VIALATFALAGSALGGPIVHFGTLGTFSGPGDLDLTGTFAYAVNLAGPSYTVGGLTFTTDGVAGVNVSADNSASPWSSRPQYGSTPDHDALENLMHSIRWSYAPNPVKVDLDVIPGARYKVQVLFNENYWSDPTRSRLFDIAIEGTLAVDELDVREVTGQWTQPQVKGIVYARNLIAQDAQMTVSIPAGSTGHDQNPILNALTLERLPEPRPPDPSDVIPEPGALLLILVGVGMRRVWPRE
jgi:hypothetical protein